MKNHFNDLIVFLVLMFIPTPVSAEIKPMDGNTLINYCSHMQKSERGDADTNFLKAGMCLGLVGGYTDSMRTTISIFSLKNNLCIPMNANWGQRIKVVVKYLEEHPEKLHMHYETLITTAMLDAFPCNEQ